MTRGFEYGSLGLPSYKDIKPHAHTHSYAQWLGSFLWRQTEKTDVCLQAALCCQLPWRTCRAGSCLSYPLPAGLTRTLSQLPHIYQVTLHGRGLRGIGFIWFIVVSFIHLHFNRLADSKTQKEGASWVAACQNLQQDHQVVLTVPLKVSLRSRVVEVIKAFVNTFWQPQCWGSTSSHVRRQKEGSTGLSCPGSKLFPEQTRAKVFPWRKNL